MDDAQSAAKRRMRCYQLVRFREPLEARDGFYAAPTGSEVVVRVTAAGVCHSDLHLCDGEHDLGGGRTVSLEGRIPMPLTPGHEIAGEVLDIGPDVDGVSRGQAVLVCSWIGCGQCGSCLAGREHLCRAPRFLGANRDGGYADIVAVPHARYLIPLDGLDPKRAAPLACSGLTTYSALRKLGLDVPIDQQPIVVIGAGGLGLMSLAILKMLGGAGAVVVEISEAKRQAALAAGALAVVDPNADGAAKAIRKAVGGEVLGVIDFVGSGETAKLGFDSLAAGGKLVIVGLFGGAMTLSVPLFPMRSVKVEGSYIGSPAELRELIALVRQHGMPNVPLDVRPLSEINEALADLQAGKVVGRVVLVP